MAVQYHLFNQFFEGKVMMHDIATGLIKLSDPIRDNHYQMWIVEQDDQIEIRCRIRNVLFYDPHLVVIISDRIT
jgi:hypothetical protein